MSLDPILRYCGIQVPSLSPPVHQRLDWCSWIGQIAVPAYAGVYALSKDDRAGFLTLAKALLINQITLELMKRLIPSLRPNGRSGSFPSGHTAAAFLGAAFLIVRYEVDMIPVTLTFFCATLVGISRVALQAHWVHDVVAGIILGTSIAYLCTKR